MFIAYQKQQAIYGRKTISLLESAGNKNWIQKKAGSTCFGLKSHKMAHFCVGTCAG